jgi:glycerol-3-phosphate O-acyltransferase 1/2
LSVIVDAFIDGLIEDAILVPVSVNYEKLVDGNFINEQMGTPKKKESFKVAINSIWKILNSKFGLMRIDFNEPFSLKELVKAFNERQNEATRTAPINRKLLTGLSRHSMYGIEVIDKHRALVDSIARHVVFDSQKATSIMSTNCVSFLLLNRFRKGVTMKRLSENLSDLRLKISSERDLAFDDDSESVIRRAIELLGAGLVSLKKQHDGEIFIKPVLSLPNVIETAYYSNTFVPHIALDAVVVTSLATVNEGALMTLNDIIEASMAFCDILRYEFIFLKPCQDFSEQIEKSLDRLEKFGMLSKNGDHVVLNYKNSKMFISALAPFSLTYLSVVKNLDKLVDSFTTLESDFLKICLKSIAEQITKGALTFGESMSTDSIKNCLKLLEKWSVVEVHLNHTVRQISLYHAYESMEDIQMVIEKIERFVILK